MDRDWQITSKSDIAFRIAFGVGVILTIGASLLYAVVRIFS